jgi:hypothetical protein
MEQLRCFQKNSEVRYRHVYGYRPNSETSPKFRKIAQISKNRPNFEKSPKFRKIAQISKNRQNLVTLPTFILFMYVRTANYNCGHVAKIHDTNANAKTSEEEREGLWVGMCMYICMYVDLNGYHKGPMF